MQRLPQLLSKDPILNRTQALQKKALDPVLANPIVNGSLLQGITLKASGTPTQVSHGLGRPYVGWFLSRPTASFSVWETAPTLPASFLTLNSSSGSAQTVDLWVF